MDLEILIVPLYRVGSDWEQDNFPSTSPFAKCLHPAILLRLDNGMG